MKKAIIFILGVCCISESAPQPKKLIPRQYNAEATRKLQEKLDSATQESDYVTPEFLNAAKALILEGADPNVKIKNIDQARLIFFLVYGPNMGTHIARKIDYPLLENVIEVALQNGADVSWTDINPGDEGKSLLFYAVQKGSPGMVKLLLDYNAPWNPKNEITLGKLDSIPKEYLAIEKRQLEQYKNEKIPETEKEIDRLQKIVDVIEQNKTRAKPVLIK